MRMRFTKTEREAFAVGARVEWRNGNRWHPAVIVGAVTHVDGWDQVSVRVHATTRTITRGDVVTAGPGRVQLRTPVVRPVDPDTLMAVLQASVVRARAARAP